MLQEHLRRIFQLLDAQENLIRVEIKQMDQEEFDDDSQRANLSDEIQRLDKSEALVKMQALHGLERNIELRKRTRKIIERTLEELGKIRSELQQLEFRERVTFAEVQAEALRTRREEISEDLIPEIEQRLAKLMDERQDIDSKLLNLSEEISLLRRRDQDVIEQGR